MPASPGRGWVPRAPVNYSLLLAFALLCALPTAQSAALDREDFDLRVWTTVDGLPHNSVSGVVLRDDGYLWVSTIDGLARFDGVRFSAYEALYGERVLSGRLTALTTHAGHLFTGDFDGRVVRIDPTGAQMVYTPERLYGDVVIGLRFQDGTLQVRRSRSGVENIADDIIDEGAVPPPQISADGWISDRWGNRWRVVRGKGIEYEDASGSALRLAQPPLNQVRAVVLDRNGQAWFALPAGLGRLSRNPVRSWQPVAEAPARDLFTSLTETRSGAIWIGSRGSGGVYVVGSRQLEPVADVRRGVTALTTDSLGRTWIGFTDGGLWWTDDDLETHQDLTPPKLGDEDPRIYAVHEDPQGRIWIGRLGGLAWLDADGAWHRDTRFDGMWIRSLAADADGDLLVGAYRRGVLRRDEDAITQLSSVVNVDSGVWGLHVDSAGVIWGGSFGHGLVRIDRGRVSQIGTSQGLPHGFVGAIASDQERLWLGTARGISMLDRAGVNAFADGSAPMFVVASYGGAGRIADQEIGGGHQQNTLTDRDGNLWFVGLRGAVRLDRTLVAQNDPVATAQRLPVYIESVELDDQRLEVSTETLRVPAGVRRVGIRFTTPDLARLEATQLRYRLVGFDDEWRSVTLPRFAEYTSLPPGRYRFEVRHGWTVADGPGAALTLDVEPFFWETLWFRVVVALMLLLLAMGAVRWVYQRRLQRQAQLAAREREMNDERARIARDLHDHLGARLTHLDLLIDGDQPEELRRRTREMALAMDEIVWSVDPKRDSVSDLFDYLDAWTEEFLAPSEVDYRYETFGESAAPLDVRRRHALFSCAQEALSNAVQHGRPDSIIVRTQVDDLLLTVDVEDDGVGLATDQVTTHRGIGGNGLQNMKVRMEEIGGACVITSGEVGTRVRLTLPVNETQ